MKHVGFRTGFVLWLIVVFGGLSIILLSVKEIQEEVQEEYLVGLGGNPNSPTCLHMYNLIEKYRKEYDIPAHVAYNVAYKETGYRGPFHWNYNPYRTSSAGAEGPMQIIPSTAKGLLRRPISRTELRNNLELNIETSFYYLRRLKNRYGSWSKACGFYNTGHPIVNGYASYCVSNTNYKNKWITP
jgi:soluble lytic murein transglycosylase-like protein